MSEVVSYLAQIFQFVFSGRLDPGVIEQKGEISYFEVVRVGNNLARRISCAVSSRPIRQILRVFGQQTLAIFFDKRQKNSDFSLPDAAREIRFFNYQRRMNALTSLDFVNHSVFPIWLRVRAPTTVCRKFG
jgi:hypothetical protein